MDKQTPMEFCKELLNSNTSSDLADECNDLSIFQKQEFTRIKQSFIDTNTIVSATEANQNFSRVTRIAEKNGQAVIFKNNRPKYVLIDLDNSPMIDMTDDEKIDVVAARILQRFKPAFMELAK